MALKVLHIVGARPNFMKAAPVIEALKKHRNVSQLLVHTGQHYDPRMSKVFFEELDLPQPDVNLEVGSGTHAVQTAQIMQRLEPLLRERRPHLVLVYGDVNSTAAAALTAVKLWIPVGHVEAGLRSFDLTMPEEINRMVTDRISDLLFTPSEDGDRNLEREGVGEERIFRVGNAMIDTVVRLLPKAEENWDAVRSRYGLGRYGLVTLHRPSNVDDPQRLKALLKTLSEVSREIPLLFPIHPRTRRRLEELDIRVESPSLKLTEPVGYLEFLCLQAHATLVITDSGGIQEETTYLKVPCITVRRNTERPVTCELGTNVLVGHDMQRLHEEAMRILRGGARDGSVPPLWDGRAGERVAAVVARVKPGSFPAELEDSA